MALLDTAGVASIAPFMAVLANPEVIATNHYLMGLYRFSGFEEINNQLADVKSFLFLLGSLVFFIMTSSIAFKAWTIYRLERYTQDCNRSLSRELVACYVRQPYSWFLNRHSSDIGKAVLSEVNAVNSGVLLPLMNVLAYGAVTVAILVLLFVVDSGLAAMVGVALGAIYGLTYLLLRNFLTNIGEDRVLANSERYKVVQEGFSGIKDIKIYGLEDTLLSRFDDPSLRFAKHTASQHIIGKLPRFFMEILAFGGILLLVLYLMATYGDFSEILPILALYTVAAYRIMPSLQQVYAQLTTIRFSMPALDLLYKDLSNLRDRNMPALSKNNTRPLGLKNNLILDDVIFRYEEQDTPAVDNISLEIKALTTIGFVGATGSGKTTTVDLILGLLTPQGGKLIVDGLVVNSKNMRAWQRSIGYVPQQIYLSDESISANIAFGNDEAYIDQEAVKRAAKIANLHEFVINELPQGYETKVGEQGVRLSGGQRQRIGIARALYYDPAILVFDEATSALDSITEKSVMAAVRGLGSKKTIIMIAHRLSTVRHCDNIIFLDKGKITDQGSYDELVLRNLSFKEMTQADN
jgi:ABC-type multidrug transport system fused ATPase/permease subunit